MGQISTQLFGRQFFGSEIAIVMLKWWVVESFFWQKITAVYYVKTLRKFLTIFKLFFFDFSKNLDIYFLNNMSIKMNFQKNFFEASALILKNIYFLNFMLWTLSTTYLLNLAIAHSTCHQLSEIAHHMGCAIQLQKLSSSEHSCGNSGHTTGCFTTNCKK